MFRIALPPQNTSAFGHSISSCLLTPTFFRSVCGHVLKEGFGLYKDFHSLMRVIYWDFPITVCIPGKQGVLSAVIKLGLRECPAKRTDSYVHVEGRKAVGEEGRG